jgi:hypothetical protein
MEHFMLAVAEEVVGLVEGNPVVDLVVEELAVEVTQEELVQGE